MVRLSKQNSFVVYEDTDGGTSKTGEPPHNAHSREPPPRTATPNVIVGCNRQSNILRHSSLLDEETDDDRRLSTWTTTTVSSVPESTHGDLSAALTHHPYTPPFIRPSFRRAESVRRMQMNSPRASVTSKPRSRTSTPRSADSRGSPRRGRIEPITLGYHEDEIKQYPLILLHISLLPTDLPWSVDSMHKLLPRHTIENLQFLRAKVSVTMLQRGVLIPHPGSEYELLEERLLEALGLTTERLTKCGHFLRRISESSEEDSDSGNGSSLDGERSVCDTCRCQVRMQSDAVGEGRRKWTVKVYAANGLMRASAWAAAWQEMESVDVEILPWISNGERQALDQRRRQEEAEWVQKQAGEQARMRGMIEYDRRQEPEFVLPEGRHNSAYMSAVREPVSPPSPPEGKKPFGSDLPAMYRPSQIPISVLLQNYVCVLARDTRNVALFCLILVLSWLMARSFSSGVESTTDFALVNHCLPCQLEHPFEQSVGLAQVVQDLATSDGTVPFLNAESEATEASTMEVREV